MKFQVHFPGVAWWREVDEMPFQLWLALRNYVDQVEERQV